MDASSTSEDVVRVARIVRRTAAEGPGQRLALWTQGCTIRCDGCFNPHLWTASGGVAMTVDQLVAEVVGAEVEGVTFLGGEPFDQAEPLGLLGAEVQRAGLSVMTFTGHRLEHLTGPEAPAGARRLLEHTDLLVDGRYKADLPDLVRPWVGSTNQQFHFLTERYAHLAQDLSRLADRIEVRVDRGGEVSVNGWATVDQLDALLSGEGVTIGRGKVR